VSPAHSSRADRDSSLDRDEDRATDARAGRDSVGTVTDRRRALVLVMLLVIVTDALLLGVHLYARTLSSPHQVYYVDADRGFGEFFQYVKFVWLIVLVAVIARDRRSWQIAMWLLPFTYFLLDDALLVHERAGARLAGSLDLPEAIGLRATDLGEHLVSGIAGVVVLLPLATGYLLAPRPARRVYHRFTVGVGALLFFGIVVDSLHIVILEEPRIGDWLGFIEDGGEMLSTSALVIMAIGFALPARPQSNGLSGLSTHS